MTVIDFDGNMKTVRTHQVIRSCGTRQCWTFALHCTVLLIATIAGLVMMITRGVSAADFGLWSSVFSLGVGGFLPQPKMKSVDGGGGGVVGLHTMATASE